MSVSQVASLLVALGYVIAATIGWRSIGATAMVVLILLLPLALIWFAVPIGRAKDYWYRGQHIDQESPPVLVAAAGWFFLVGLPIAIYFLSRPSL
jgi:hypothetical protein